MTLPIMTGSTSDSKKTAAHILPAADCAPLAILALGLLGDVRRWSAQFESGLADKYPEAMSFAVAAIAPWSDVESLSLFARMSVWLYGIDDVIDTEANSLDEVDDVLATCVSIASGGDRDDSHPVYSSLADLYAGLRRKPIYPDLHGLWTDKFDSCMRGMRYSWRFGRGQINPTIGEYIDDAHHGILHWINTLTFWISTADREILQHLDVLIPAADDLSVIARLANDLATSAREKREGIGNATLLASTSWIMEEIARRREAVGRRLAPLLDAEYGPALFVTRAADWAVAFYRVIDFRAATDVRQA
jgi:terpene synthase-like protein